MFGVAKIRFWRTSMKRRLFFVVCFLSAWVCSLDAFPNYPCDSASVNKIFNGALKEHIEQEQIARAHILFDTHLSPEQIQERLKIFDREQFSKFLAIARPLIDSLSLFKKAPPSPFLTSFKNFSVLVLYVTAYSMFPQYSDFTTRDCGDFPSALKLLYTSFERAHKLGLDPLSYTKAFPTLHPCAHTPCSYLGDLTNSADPFTNLWNTHFADEPTEIDTIDAPDINTLWGNIRYAWLLIQLYQTPPLLETLLNDPHLKALKNAGIFTGLWWLHHIQFYISALFNEKYPNFRTSSDLSPQQIILKHPQLCLYPQYLTDKSEDLCLKNLKNPSKSTLESWQTYLKTARLVNIDDTPCMYLNPQGKIQTFKSDNAICLALQRMKFLW